MDSTPLTQPRLLPILSELKQLEPIFHTEAFGKTRVEYENFMDEGYWEIGASVRTHHPAVDAVADDR